MSSPTRVGRSRAASTGRFSRTGTTQRQRTSAPQRHGVAGGWLQRSQPQQSRRQRMLSGAAGALPSMTKRRSTTSSSTGGRAGKAGGVALLAGAAGLIFRYRDKVASFARRNDTHPVTPTSGGMPTTNDGTGDAPKF